MVKMPLAMGQAMSQHSNVIRRAAWTHYGFVVGQEGDSFVLAFRDALDAVAFCLQVSTLCTWRIAIYTLCAWLSHTHMCCIAWCVCPPAATWHSMHMQFVSRGKC
jgi:hypothetical protein